MTTPEQPTSPETEGPTPIEVEADSVEVEAGPDRPPEQSTETPAVEAEPERPPEQRTERVFVGTGLFWGLLFGVVVAVAFIILAAQNTVETPVRFLSWEMSTPLIALILVSFLGGVILDEIVGLVYRARRRRILQEREELRALREREDKA